MKRATRFMLSALLLLSAASASAFTPENGFWWNPLESGRGWNFEIQDNVLVITAYIYSGDGDPDFYIASGTLDGNSFFEAEFNLVTDGQCLGCPYTAPTVLQGFGGPVTVDFTSETAAVMEWDGVTIPIQRHKFGIYNDEHEIMLGEWKAVIDVSSEADFPFLGDVFIFDLIGTCEGVDCFQGCRPDNAQDGFCSNFALNNHDAAGAFDPDTGFYVVVLRESESQYLLLFDVLIGTNRFGGFAEFYNVGGSPSLVGFPFEAYRTASKSFVQTGVGPSKSASDDKTGHRGGLLDALGGELILQSPENLPKSGQGSLKSEAEVARLRQMIRSLESQLK